MTDLPDFKENPWATPQVAVTRREDGCLIVDCGRTPKNSYPNLIAMLKRTVATFPERSFLAERRDDGSDNPEWTHITYKEIDRQAEAIAQWLISLGPEPGNMMILSHNTLEHGAVNLAGMMARFPVAPISPNYSLLSKDFTKLKAIAEKLSPKVIFVQNIEHYSRALRALSLDNCTVLYAEGSAPDDIGAVSFADAVTTTVTEAVAESIARIKGDDVAKILFTSGSTGDPKGVINTHTNLCFTQASLLTIIDVDEVNNPPILLDWMPWHHTYGGNQNVNRVIKNGGTLYIDDGKPLPGLFEKTLRNIKSVTLNSYTTVPAVYALLVDAMERDDELRKAFFHKLEWCSYGGSDMPQETFDHFQQLAIRTTGQRITMITALGATESTAITTIVHWSTSKMGSIGLPLPGATLKLIPQDDKYELCVKGPQITPGYYNGEHLNRKAFDNEGYLHTGDAVRWLDPEQPLLGLQFAGRVSEDFKLLNGTWVHTSMLRIDLLSELAPLVFDVVITGQDKPYLGLLIWLNEDVVRRVFGLAEASTEQLAQHPRVMARIQTSLRQHNEQHSGASVCIERALILTTPPCMDSGEMSDKRSINQQKVQALRPQAVNALYVDEPGANILTELRQPAHQAALN
ncbi:AMP-binding protein [Alteromonas gilva]|uniref:AMP-binding protein n=1 Tax=Alteromonas gilva TaxID=2987522 RepID=A0ABT5KZE4_9ALTE|nr:AMP-binding protein [Alteromonas gilva]MDC8830131.1 AMP-binding protein [Alteromonas gilva]